MRVGMTMALAAACGIAGIAAAADMPDFVPWPKSVDMRRGQMTIAGSCRIVAATNAVAPLAAILSDEIRAVTGLRLATDSGEPGAGDIGIALDPALSNAEHRVEVSDRVRICGGDYVGAGMGATTVLQALRRNGGKVLLPRMTVRDRPYPEYTGMMMDVARQFNSVESLRQLVILARLYKMKYLHLHLTDDQMFTFPSAKYPKLKGVYTLEELKALVRFADERGVTIVPEMEVPGHSSVLAAAMPEVFGDTQGCVINFINPRALPILRDLINEMCDVFQSSPFFHIGSDESNFALFETWPDVVENRKLTGRNTPQQHCWLINELNATIKQRGKRTICWEGFEMPEVDKDVIVMEWDGRFFSPIPITKAGYRIINVPWEPSVGWSARDNYEWNMWLVGSQERKPDQLDRGAPVIGGQMVLWECPGEVGLPMLRTKAVPRHERVHSPDAGRTYEDFDRRFASTDRILDLLVHGFAVDAEGLTNHGDNRFDQALTLTVSRSPGLPAGATIRCSSEAWQAPTTNSPAYTGAVHLTSSRWVNLQAFGADGTPIGFPRLASYDFCPIAATAAPLLPKEIQHENRYCQPLVIKVQCSLKGDIRYTLDGKEPTTNSPACTDGTIRLERSSTPVRCALFVNGKKAGQEWRQDYIYLDYEKNLTTGKPVRNAGVPGAAWATNSPAVDGFIDRNNHWCEGSGGLEVDLEKVVKLGEIDLYPWFGDGRYYQYLIEVSEDGKTWVKVVDGSQNTVPTTDKGYRHQIQPVRSRYIRVTMLRNSVNTGYHIVEVRAYEAP